MVAITIAIVVICVVKHGIGVMPMSSMFANVVSVTALVLFGGNMLKCYTHQSQALMRDLVKQRMKGNEMNVTLFSNIGKKHKENQDSINMFYDENYTFIALSDGAGYSNLAKTASLITVNTALSYCKVNRKEWLKSFAKFKEGLIFCIRNAYEDIVQKKSVDFDLLSATLILFGYSKKNKRYFIIHIGDGAVYVSDASLSKYKILSAPHNGYQNSETFFVNDKKIHSKVRYQLGILENTENTRILICTDGFYNEIPISEFSAFLKSQIVKDNVDDCTYALISI